jgi:hypothetical protein
MTDAVFYDHEVVQRAPDEYIEMTFNPALILKAWALSMFAHEILTHEGDIRDEKNMNEATLAKFLQAQDAFKKGEKIPKPIIGVGIMDNIEIGIGRETVAAALALNIRELPIHTRQGQAEEVKSLIK